MGTERRRRGCEGWERKGRKGRGELRACKLSDLALLVGGCLRVALGGKCRDKGSVPSAGAGDGAGEAPLSERRCGLAAARGVRLLMRAGRTDERGRFLGRRRGGRVRHGPLRRI